MLINEKEVGYYVSSYVREQIGWWGFDYSHMLFNKKPDIDALYHVPISNVMYGINMDFFEDAIKEYSIVGEGISIYDDNIILLMREGNFTEITRKTLFFVMVKTDMQYEANRIHDEITAKIREKLSINTVEKINEIYIAKQLSVWENEKEQYEHNVTSAEIDIEECERRLASYKEILEIHKKRLERFKEKMKRPRSLIDDLTFIDEHKLVKNMSFNTLTNELVIETKTLYMNHPFENDRRLLGEFDVYINLSTFNPKFKNKTHKRKSYWGDECNHPHVEQNGSACLGNLSSMLSECNETKDLYAAFLLLMDFLQTFEPNDPAGEYYVCWDKVDDNDNIIEKGQCDKYDYRCIECGEGIPEDDYYVCCECNEYVCENCIVYVNGIDEYMCPSCADEYTEFCADCDERWHTDALTRVAGDLYVCPNCLNDHYVICGDCEEYIHEDNAIWDATDGMYRCPDCAPKPREEY